MIYRILADTVEYRRNEANGELESMPMGTQLRGLFTAGLSEGLADLPMPSIRNSRARFYFTEAGWRKYGRNAYAAARKRGHAVRVMRLKNPDKSQVIYRDAWQVAILVRGDRE